MRRAASLLLVLASSVAAGTIWIVTDRRASQRVYDVYSSANTSNEGLSLAAGYLAKTRKVAQLTRPLARESLERNAVVFRVVKELAMMEPEEVDEKQVGPPKPRLRPLITPDEERFVREGGRLIIAASSGALETTNAPHDVATKVFPMWPDAGDIEILRKSQAFLTLRPRMHAIYVSGTRPVLARERIGGGELFVLSAPEALSNEWIEDNLALVAGLAGDRRPVYFDEVIHGLMRGQGMLSLARDWNLGPFLLLGMACAVLIFWREGRRIGPPEDDFRETRSDAVDLVRSLGALYDDVTLPEQAIALYHDALTRTVAHTTGLRGDALHKRVDDLTGGKLVPGVSLERALTVLNEGFSKVSTKGV